MRSPWWSCPVTVAAETRLSASDPSLCIGVWKGKWLLVHIWMRHCLPVIVQIHYIGSFQIPRKNGAKKKKKKSVSNYPDWCSASPDEVCYELQTDWSNEAWPGMTDSNRDRIDVCVKGTADIAEQGCDIFARHSSFRDSNHFRLLFSSLHFLLQRISNHAATVLMFTEWYECRQLTKAPTLSVIGLKATSVCSGCTSFWRIVRYTPL